MVSDPWGGAPDRPGGDRAQLLLVGAIALALVLMGLVVVFNTVLFTEATTPTETLESADEAETLNQQVRNDTRQIMRHVANETTDTCPDFCSSAEQNITIYSRGLSISKGHTGPVFVNITNIQVDPVLCSQDLCASYTFVYETEQFRYVRQQIVGVASPLP